MDNSTTSKLKVLAVTPVPPPFDGGIATWTHCISKGFEDVVDLELLFIDTTVRFRRPTNAALIFRLTGGSYQAIYDSFRTYHYLKKHRPDVLHLCTSAGLATIKDILILRIAKCLGISSVIHYHMGRLPSIIARNGIDWRLTRHAMLSADAVVLLDRESQTCVEQAVPSIRSTILPNMVETDTIDSLGIQPSPVSTPTGHLSIVYVGHVIPAKGIRELVTACLQQPRTSLILDIVGPINPNYQMELEEIAAVRDGGKWLRFHGKKNHDEAMRFIGHADIFVLPSYTEGMPNVILEAMSCGRAILSTTVGAIPEMLDIGGPQQCGICVPPRNVNALTNALAKLIDHPEERLALGQIAQQRVREHYSVPAGCAQLLNLWKSVSRKSP